MFLHETLPSEQPMKMSYNNLSNSVEVSKLIKTIKSPTFFNNCDEITSSFSYSDKTDPDYPFSPKICMISTHMANNATEENDVVKKNKTRYQGEDNIQQFLPKSKKIQTCICNYTRPL